MQLRALSIVLLMATLLGTPSAATAQIYKWVDADGSVHYGNSAPRSKNARVIGSGSGTVSVIPGLSKEEKEWLRAREEELRLQRLEREVEELRARELTRAYASPEVVYVESYVPVFGYGPPLHRRHHRDVKPRPDYPLAKVRPPQRTPPVEDPTFSRTPTGALSRR